MNNSIAEPIIAAKKSTHLLTGFSFHELAHTDEGLSQTTRSLAYQAQKLGIDYHPLAEQSPKNALENKASFPSSGMTLEFTGPGITPITCHVSGWHDNTNLPASENIIQAATGIMSIHGRFCGELMPLGIDYVSTITACLTLQGAIAAALAQLHGQAMTTSSTSMAASALLTVGQYLAGATAPEEPENILPRQNANIRCLPFISADGIAFEIETLSPKPWKNFWQAMKADSKAISQGWQAFVLRYAKAIAPIPNALIERISEYTFKDIENIGQATNVSVCRIRTDEENQSDRALGIQQGPWQFSQPSLCSSSLLSTTHPHQVNDNCSTKTIENQPLKGITVIESCRRIQGPLAGNILRLLGASVTRIEPLGGDTLRGMPPMADGCSARFDALNNNKDIHEIDIKSSTGQQKIQEMASHADVFLHNWAPNKAAELNLDHDNLITQNPALIYAYAGGWGTKANDLSIPGTDFMAQAYSGVAHVISQTSKSAGGSLFTILDVLGGVISSQAIVAALLHRKIHHTSLRVDTSLLDASNLLLLNSANSHTHLQGVFASKTRCITFECQNERQSAQLLSHIDPALTAASQQLSLEELCEKLQAIFLLQPANYWIEKITNLGIPCAIPVEDLTELLTDPKIQSHLQTQSYTQVNNPWRFSL